VRIQTILKDELTAIKNEFATPRRTVIIDQEGEMEDEDLIQREDMVVTVSHAGYVKRVPLSTYRAQRRGGKGRAGMQNARGGFRHALFVASTHAPVLFFSSRGQSLQGKGVAAALAAPQARGKALIISCRSSRARASRRSCAAGGRESSLGQARRDVRNHARHGPAQQAVGFFRTCGAPASSPWKLDAKGDGIVDVQICTENDDCC